MCVTIPQNLNPYTNTFAHTDSGQSAKVRHATFPAIIIICACYVLYVSLIVLVTAILGRIAYDHWQYLIVCGYITCLFVLLWPNICGCYQHVPKTLLEPMTKLDMIWFIV